MKLWNLTDGKEVRTLRGVVTALAKGRGRVLAKLAARRAAAYSERIAIRPKRAADQVETMTNTADMNYEALYARIEARFDEMLAEGLLDEVRALHGRGDLHADLPSMRAVGYRQLWRHLEGDCPLEVAVADAKRATRNLAKRQLTWLRADAGVRWHRSLEDQELGPILQSVEQARPG